MDPQPIMQTRFIDFVGPSASSDSLKFAMIQVTALSAFALAGSAPVFNPNRGSKPASARALHCPKDRIAGVVRIIDDHALRVESILQRRANRMDRRCTAFAHTFRAIEGEWRWRFHVAIQQIGHVHRSDRSIVAESRGQQIAIAVVRAILHQRGADAMRGAAVYLPFHDPGIYGAATIVHTS